MCYFHVILGKKHIDMVLARDETHAIEIVRNLWGDSKLYSSVHSYTALRA